MKPGSAAWLLRHELRLFFFNAGARSGKGGRRKWTSIALWTFITLALHGFAYMVVGVVGRADPTLMRMLPMIVTLVCVVAFTLMLSVALRSAVEVLFQRGDLDLLLSSPLPSRSIFTVRLAAIAMAASAVLLFLLAPVANAGLLHGQPRWLTLYPLIISMALVAASIAILATLGLVRTIGVRQTRVVAQLLGALSGAVMFLSSQAYNAGMRDATSGMLARIAPLLAPGQSLGPDSVFWLPGRAALGEPLAALAVAIVGIAAFCVTVQLTHRFFVRGTQMAVSAVRAAPNKGALRYRFGRSLTQVVMIKEWRLIQRDPQLISQVLLQLLYMLPMCFVLLSSRGETMPRAGSALLFICASLTTSLAWIIISAEDAPDLLQTSPAATSAIRRGKLLAVALPPLLLMTLPLAWFGARDPVAGMVLALITVIGVASAALIVLWGGRPGKRGDFKTRARGSFASTILELLGSIAWSGVAFLLLSSRLPAASPWMPVGACFAAAGGIVVLLLAWLLRRRTP